MDIKDLDSILEETNNSYIQYPERFKAIEAGAGLSRIMTHVNSGEEFIIITAFRGEYSRNENVRRNSEMLQDVKNQQLGAIQLEGHYVEK